MGKGLDPKLLMRLVEEALSRIAGPEVASRLIQQALLDAGNWEPADEAQFSVFVGGPLYQAVERTLTTQDADTMMAFIDPILNTWLTQSSSGAWRKSHQSARGPAPSSSSGAAVVIAVSASSELAELLKGALCAEGYSVHCAATGREAVDRARAIAPELIVVDSALPAPVDALKLVKLLRMALADEAPEVLLLGDPTSGPVSGATVVQTPLARDMLRNAAALAIQKRRAARH